MNKTRIESGTSRFKWVIILLLINTVLLFFILVNQYRIVNINRSTIGGSKGGFAEVEPESLPPVGSSEEAISPAEVVSPIRVEVLNGCKVPKLAGRTADFLRTKGFDVRVFTNAPEPPSIHSHTMIYVRCADKSKGEKLAETIGLPLEMVKMEANASLTDIDVTLLLGKDYKKYVLPR